MAINDGDILSALSELKTDTSKISQSLSTMSEKDLHQIQQDLNTLVRLSQGTQRSNENDRFQRQRDERIKNRQAYSYESSQRYSQGSSKSSFSRGSNSRVSAAYDGVIDEFFGSIGEGMKDEIRKSMSNSPFKKQIQGYLKKFANDLGIEVSQLPSMLGKDLGKYVIQNTKIGKQITSTFQGMQDRLLSSLLSGAKRGVSDYVSKVGGKNVDFDTVYQHIVDKFRTEHGIGEDSQSVGASSSADTIYNETISPSGDALSVLNQINDSVFAILNHLDASAADNLKREAAQPQKKGKAKRKGKGEGGPEESEVPSSDGSLESGNKYDPDMDLFNTFKDKAKGIYDMMPESLKSIIGDFTGTFGDITNKVGSNVTSWLGEIGGDVVGGAGGDMLNLLLPEVADGAIGGTAAGLGGAGAAGGLSGILTAIGPEGWAAMAAIAVVSIGLDQLGQAFGPAIEGINKFSESAKKASNRFYVSQKEMIKEEQKRIEADVRVMAETPFKIMEEAAQKWYDAWDNNLKTIGQTQGYTKADVQTLFGSYAERLRAEGLGSVISAADISTNLGKVIESGLSGKVAEEFAYQATLLGSAIPNQDFFGYADTYGQIVGNALAKGLSKDAAIQEATKQMQQHASNILYASRNLSDGIASALKDGSSLFADAVKIANTARTGESSQISAVLTAAAAEVSAIAPDLASDLISNIVQAAVGGNNSDLVALRSMAGIGASNTAFIQELATNPQKVFAALFSNLAQMQNLDRNNYMEVAESLSQTFGISASAFERIDFTSLAQAISSMQVNQSALSENLKLLKSGETTTSPEAMRMQQINQMILDEGLAYVLDSEAGRAIQQHMWDQELANEIMEREYSVDFAGSAKEMIQGIFETIHNILNFLNPFAWVSGLVNIAATGAEYDAQKADLARILQAGKVGRGNPLAFHNLTTYNGTMLNTVPSLMQMLGLASSYSSVHGGLTAYNAIFNGTPYSTAQYGGQAIGAINAGLQTALASHQSSVNSKYSWGFVGKSLANAIASTPMTGNALGSMMPTISSSDAIRKQQAKKIETMIGSMDEIFETLKSNPFDLESGAVQSYEEWKSEQMNKYNITDFNETLGEVGLTEAEVRSRFESGQAQAVSEYNYTRDRKEDEFWEEAIKYYTITFPIEYSQPQLEKMDTLIELLTNFYNDWTEKWLNQAWEQEWVSKSWNTDWLEDAWNQKWLTDAWDQNWLKTAWGQNWLNEAWYQHWLTEGWYTYWLNDAWYNGWLNNKWMPFFNAWTSKYITYDLYSSETKDAYKAIESVKSQDKQKQTGDAVLALAKALTANTVELKDPQVQTNALLSQILIVIEAILQAENTSGGASLATSLAALGLGLTT